MNKDEKCCECEHYRNLLEDVVNELDLSETMQVNHGPLGTPPSELVRLVLDGKDREIRALKAKWQIIKIPKSSTPSPA